MFELSTERNILLEVIVHTAEQWQVNEFGIMLLFLCSDTFRGKLSIIRCKLSHIHKKCLNLRFR